jgi:hypothetical protein
MQLSCDYHATNDQFIMTIVMLSHGIFKEYYINQIYYQKIYFNHFLKVFDSYTWTNSFVPHGNVYDYLNI